MADATANPVTGTDSFDDYLNQVGPLLKARTAVSNQTLQQLQDIQKRRKTVEDEPVPPIPKPANLEPLPKRPPTPPENPMEAFGQPATVLAIFASLLTRAPLTAAMNAAAGAMRGYRQGYLDQAKQYEEEYRDNLDAAIQQNNSEIQKYREVLEAHNVSVQDKLAKLQSIAAESDDAIVQNSIRTGNIDFIEKVIDTRQNHADMLQQRNLDRQFREQQLNLETLGLAAKLYEQQYPIGGPPFDEFVRKMFPNLATTGDPTPQQSPPVEGGGAANAPPSTGQKPEDIHGDAYLQTLPKEQGTLIRALAEGRQMFPTGFALRSPYWQKVLEMVGQYDPSFDAINYNSRWKTRSDFTSGQSAKNVTSLNTVLGHLARLKQIGDSLNNGDIPTANSILNFLAKETGDPRVTNFQTAKQAVTDELERTFRGTSGSVTGIRGWSDKLTEDASPAQMQGAWNTLVDLLDSRLDALSEQYSRGMGVTTQGLTLLSPKARQAYEIVAGRAPSVPTVSAQGQITRSGANMPVVRTQEDFDSLDPGTTYIGEDGGYYKKPEAQ